MTFLKLFLLCSLLSVGSTSGIASASYSVAPAVSEVSKQALRYAHLNTDHMSSWERKVHKAPLLPHLEMGFDRRLQNQMNVNLADSVSVTSTGVNVGPPQQTQIQNANNAYDFQVKAVWRLNELIFSREDLNISTETRLLTRERSRLLTEVRENYFKREIALKEGKKIDAAKATAALDDLTGGWFSTQIGGGR